MADRYDWDRDRERDQERGGRRESRGQESNWPYSGEGRYGEERGREWRRGEPWSGEYRGYPPERGDYNTRGDWGRQGSWGSYGNRPDFNRDYEWRGGEWRGRGWERGRGREEGDFGRYGTEYGGYGGGYGSRYGTEYGGYSGGMGSFGGGMGTYGERGRFAGRGPKGWHRSDDRIRDDMNERLTDHPDVDASEINVEVKNGEVTLTGSVDNRHAKRLAEDIAENVSGVKDVHNQLRVQEMATQGRSMSSGGTTTTGGSGNR